MGNDPLGNAAGVQLELTGLTSEKQALAGMHHMERLLCAGEIKTQ